MTTEAISQAKSDAAAIAVQPELMVSSVLHLMSHYTAAHTGEDRDTRLAAVIERHLKALAELPELTPVLRATCRDLAGQWAGVVERTMHPPQRQHRFLRFIAGGR